MSQKTILLIDDDADLLQVIGERCRRAGYRVEQARNLLTATTLIDRCMPDVICIDVQMPTGSGLNLCEMLAADPKTADLPIIVLTGQRDAETLKMCRRLQLEYTPKQTDAWKTLQPLIEKMMSQPRKRRLIPDTGLRPQPLPTPQIPPLPSEFESNGRRSQTKQIIVADDDADLVRLLSQRFSSLGCSVIGASSAIEAINAIHRVMPDLVCLDVNMPSGNGLSVCEMMASDDRLRAVPVIILTGCSDQTTIRRCHDMLVFYVQKGTNIWSRIEPLVCELLHLEDAVKQGPQSKPWKMEAKVNAIEVEIREDGDALMDAVFAMLGSDSGDTPVAADAKAKDRVEQKKELPWVLCIDDDKDFSDAMKVRLEACGVAVARAYNGVEGYRMVFTHPASAIFLDYNMPNGQGDYVLDRLKSSPVTKDIPVFIITGAKDKVLERRMLAMGAAGFFNKPVAFSQLRDKLADYIDVLAVADEAVLV